MGFTQGHERGNPTSIRPQPWQRDTLRGGWFRLDNPFADFQPRSKNGSLLLNFPQRGEGTFCPECETVPTCHPAALPAAVRLCRDV